MKKLFYFFLILVAVSCSQEKAKNGAVIYSFDDQYIDQWYNHRELFNQYDIKATFFIHRPNLLDSSAIAMLKQLQADGHEIAFHGTNHRNVLDFKDSVDVLLEKEIVPGVDCLRKQGFEVQSYAYPFGQSNPPIDSMLLYIFPYLRKATYNIHNTTIDQYDEIYVSSLSQRIMNSMGIDNNYGIDLPNFEKGLLRAQKNNEVLVLHAHRIDTTFSDYTVNSRYLENTFQLCKKHNIPAIRVADLESFFQDTKHTIFQNIK